MGLRGSKTKYSQALVPIETASEKNSTDAGNEDLKASTNSSLIESESDGKKELDEEEVVKFGRGPQNAICSTCCIEVVTLICPQPNPQVIRTDVFGCLKNGEVTGIQFIPSTLICGPALAFGMYLTKGRLQMKKRYQDIKHTCPRCKILIGVADGFEAFQESPF